MFPLPFTPFELLMWQDDRRGYPMTYCIDSRFTGRFRPELLQQAWEQVVRRQPLLGARVTTRWGRPYWVPGAGCPRLAFVPAGHATTRFPYIDLRVSPPLYGEVHEHAGESRLFLFFHHCASDGIGALNFLSDLLAAYHLACVPGDPDVELRPVEPQLLLERGRSPEAALAETRRRKPEAPLTEPAPAAAAPSPLEMARIAGEFFTARVTPVAYPRRGAWPGAKPPVLGTDGGPLSQARPYVSLRLPPELIRELRANAAAAKATLNELMLWGMFRTLHDWNEMHGRGSPRSLFRLAMPVSLRVSADRPMPASNVLSYAFIERWGRDCGSPAELFDSIRTESQDVRTAARSIREFSASLGFANLWPPALLWGLPLIQSFTTSVLSYLGECTRRFASKVKRQGDKVLAGDVLLEEVCAAPPVRPGTRLTVAVFAYNDALSFSAHADPRRFTREDTARFLAELAWRLTDPLG